MKRGKFEFRIWLWPIILFSLSIALSIFMNLTKGIPFPLLIIMFIWQIPAFIISSVLKIDISGSDGCFGICYLNFLGNALLAIIWGLIGFAIIFLYNRITTR